ncbi:unnamed protein product, partial [Vitis vinifera]|uniref:Uncharacterized protein n=1 Tax=Vitis vinifera TaxID=29760 RepID=D7TA56_VITVI
MSMEFSHQMRGIAKSTRVCIQVEWQLQSLTLQCSTSDTLGPLL